MTLDYHVVEENTQATQVMIAACKREPIDNLKRAIQLSGKQPVVIP